MVGKIGVEIPKEILTASVPGKIYHLVIDYSGAASDEMELALALTKGLYDEFKAKVLYMNIDENSINIQLEGSPFAWALLIPWIPSILTLFGLTLIGIAVYTVLAAIPSWAWGLLAVGVLSILVAPTVGAALKPVKVKKK
jgi:hypothetical protein